MSTDPRYTLFAARAVFDSRLTATDVRVLAAMGTFSDRQGWCHPSQATIARRIGVVRTTVNAAISSLVAAGYVQAVKQTRDSGAQAVSLYRVLIDLPAPEAVDAAAEGAEILEFMPVVVADTPPVSPDDTLHVVTAKPEQSQHIAPPVVVADTPPVSPDDTPCRRRTTPNKNIPIRTNKSIGGPFRLPDDWTPRSSEISFGTEGGLSEAEVLAAADHMRDWANANSKRKASWDLTFRNWLRTAISDAKRGRRPVVSGVDQKERRRRLAVFEHDGTWRPEWGPQPIPSQTGGGNL